MIRNFILDDYDKVYHLWKETPGMGLRNQDDSREGIARFIGRNPATSFVAEKDGKIIGTALSGHDGRRGYLYHVCVAEGYRRRSIGKQLVEHVIDAMKAEKITRLALFCKSENEVGNDFWNRHGWIYRADLNFYSLCIDEDN